MISISEEDKADKVVHEMTWDIILYFIRIISYGETLQTMGMLSDAVIWVNIHTMLLSMCDKGIVPLSESGR